MLLDRGLRGLRDLGELALRALSNHFERGNGMHMRADRIADVALVELSALFLLKFVLRHLLAALSDLLLDLADVADRAAVARSGGRQRAC